MLRIPSAALLAAFTLAACGSPPATDQPARPAGGAAADNDAAGATSDAGMNKNDVYSLKAIALDGKPVDMSAYRGRVTLVVNVASECGYTPQYAGLQQLHSELQDRGFAVLGFPSNEFGGQEPGSPEQIQQFCSSRYGVEFPMFAKVETRPGANQSPIYRALTTATGEQPGWNFCKYLVGKDGEVLGFYGSSVKPDSAQLRQAIEGALE